MTKNKTSRKTKEYHSRNRGPFILGLKFGTLYPLYRTDRITMVGGHRVRQHYLCRCDCGNYFEVTKSNLTCKRVTHCGCVKNVKMIEVDGVKKIRISGTGENLSHTTEYTCWISMRNRVKPNARGHEDYHDRGIGIFPEWDKLGTGFTLFFEHVGPRPGPEYSLDRINNDYGYFPGNVRWATAKQQAANRRKNVSIGKFTLEELETELAKRREAHAN